MKTIIRQLLLVVALACCALPASSQVKEMLKIINDRGGFRPYVQWLYDDNRANTYINNIHKWSIPSMQATLENMSDDHVKAQQILTARNEILGEKLVKKLDGKPSAKTLAKVDEILAKRFNEVDRLKAAFESAIQVERRYEMLSSAIKAQLSSAPPRVMPQGALRSFDYSTGNGFAGFHLEVSLKKADGKNILRIKEQRMMHSFDNERPQPTPYDVEVDDSVMQRVRDFVEEGKLYDIGSDYMPDYDITDASNWSLSIYFEKGGFSSGGYASGPDHSDALGKIVRYLTAIYEELKPQPQQAGEQD